jgi:uncharacterized protein (DUF2235 family)
MGKNLVVCCDGTWNDPDELRDHIAEPTNVAKLALALVSDVEKQEGEQAQLMHYEPGVGTSPDERLIGGAFGYGLSHNIRNGYRFLAQNYTPGDRVFLFGFSRGAYTARSLAGLIHNCGILRAECVDQADAAFAFYRDRTNQTHPKTIASHIFRDMYSYADSKVFFIGVWDTVGALGIPEQIPGWEELSKVFTGWEKLWGFHDTELSPEVEFAYHALAIDEERPPYEPTLWTQADTADGQTLEQVWFSGVHSEIGGGTSDSALSDIPFLWMVDKARTPGPGTPGVLFKSGQPTAGSPALGVKPPAPNYAAAIVQSRRGPWQLLHPYHRLHEASVRSAPHQWISSSAARRFADQVGGYSPPGLKDYLAGGQVMPAQEEPSAS